MTIAGIPGALALLLLLIAALSLLKRPSLGPPFVAAVAYLLPFSVPPVEILDLSPSTLDFILFFALVAWSIPLALKKKPKPITGPLGLPLLLFLTLAVFSFALALDRTHPGQARMFIKLVNSLLLYFTVINTIKTARDLERTVTTVLVCAGVAGGVAVVLYFLGPELDYLARNALSAIGYPGGESIVRQVYGTNVRRAVGTAVDPNLLGGMLALAIPLAAPQLIGGHPLLPHRVLWPAVLMMIAAQVFTYSRGGWLAAGAGLLSLALFRYPKALVVLALYLPFLLLPQGQVIVERTVQAAEASDPASRLRLNEYQDAIGVIARYPFFGAGFGSAPADVPYLGVSSIYLYVAELTGLIGLALFLWTLLALARYAFPALFRGLRPDPVLAGIAAAVVAAVTAGLLDHYFFNPLIPHTTALFWLFIALLARAVAVYAKKEPRVRARGPLTS